MVVEDQKVVLEMAFQALEVSYQEVEVVAHLEHGKELYQGVNQLEVVVEAKVADHSSLEEVVVLQKKVA